MEEPEETSIIAPSQPFYQSRAQKRTSVIVLIALSVFFLASILYHPPDARADGSYFTICAFKNIVGLPCPGCGLAHSLCAMGKGSVVEAFRFNLLGPAVYFLFFSIWLRSVCVLASWTQPVLWMDRAASRVKLIPLFIALFAAFGIGRIIYLLLT
ncbi:MAG: DUF2752 domain-containing protein [Acidobacteriota bacterium]